MINFKYLALLSLSRHGMRDGYGQLRKARDVLP